MGCDTHMYIEYKSKDSDYWSSFGERINPGRNYRLFGLMSKGVRSEFPESFQAKGLPDNMSYAANDDNQIFISETQNDNCVKMQTAQQWVDKGISKFVNDNQENPSWVTNPDWHSHTWLTLPEMKHVLDTYNSMEGSFPAPGYQALFAAMKSLNDDGYDVRVILWFDS